MVVRHVLRILFWLAALSPLAIALCSMPFMPDWMAIHFGTTGTADRWGSPFELLVPGIASLVIAAALEASVAREQSGANATHLAGCLAFLLLAVTTAVICTVSVGTEDGGRKIPELAAYRYIPALCWLGMGLFLLCSRTVRYLNLNAPWILLDRRKDRKAALFGGVSMLIAGCLALAIAVWAGDSAGGLFASSLVGCIGLLGLYVFCHLPRARG